MDKKVAATTKHITYLRSLSYVHLQDPTLGNRSQAVVNAKKGINIFESRYVFVPLYSNAAWHFASCLVVNHDSLCDNSDDRDTDASVFPCTLELNSAGSMLDHDIIIDWLNDEYKIQYGATDAPFTKESMPYFRVPCTFKKSTRVSSCYVLSRLTHPFLLSKTPAF